MKADNTIERHPSWLKEGQTLRCLTPDDRVMHKGMSEIIYEVIKEFTRAGKRRNLLPLDLTKE